MTKYRRFFHEAKRHFFLFGPRGTGKSTWLKENHPHAAWIDLLDAAAYRSYLARPERLGEFAAAHRAMGTIVVDEVQRVPQLLPMIHKIMEANADVRFILTGSSARKLKQTGVDLLAGRAVVKHMHPFMAAEMGDRFDLPESLRLGMIPLVRSAAEPRLTLRGYIDLYLQQEVVAEGMARNIDGFARFLEAVSFSHGSLLNVADISRECEVKRSTVVRYIEVIEDLLIARRLPVFAKRAKRSLIAHQKFYFFDSGVFQSIRPAGALDSEGELTGPALEGLILQHLQAWIDYGGLSLGVYYWRTRTGSEVDFILYGKDGFFAIEVKNGERLHPRDFQSLRTFREDYPQCRAILVYRGREILQRDDILCVPVGIFLKSLVPGKGLLHFLKQ